MTNIEKLANFILSLEHADQIMKTLEVATELKNSGIDGTPEELLIASAIKVKGESEA